MNALYEYLRCYKRSRPLLQTLFKLLEQNLQILLNAETYPLPQKLVQRPALPFQFLTWRGELAVCRVDPLLWDAPQLDEGVLRPGGQQPVVERRELEVCDHL